MFDNVIEEEKRSEEVGRMDKELQKEKLVKAIKLHTLFIIKFKKFSFD